MITLKEKYFEPLKDGSIRICKIGDEVAPMWGMGCVLLTAEQIKALLNGDCIWFTDEEYATVLRAEAVIDKFPKWIPVTERMPEEMEMVLVTDGKNVCCSFCVNNYGRLYFYVPWNITHWMPIPLPPKEGQICLK